MTDEDLTVPPAPLSMVSAVEIAYHAGVAAERAKHGWWWQRRARRREAERLHWLAFGWIVAGFDFDGPDTDTAPVRPAPSDRI